MVGFNATAETCLPCASARVEALNLLVNAAKVQLEMFLCLAS